MSPSALHTSVVRRPSLSVKLVKRSPAWGEVIVT